MAFVGLLLTHRAAYKSFEDWSGGNQAVADAARELYTDIESLELYVCLPNFIL